MPEVAAVATVEPVPPPTDHSAIAVASARADLPSAWRPGMALDARVADRKPTLAVKAQRFWKTAATASAVTHFDHDNLTLMNDGKAPRRLNPRTGKIETMQLVGLRRASRAGSVRMRWPGDAVDPWSAP